MVFAQSGMDAMLLKHLRGMPRVLDMRRLFLSIETTMLFICKLSRDTEGSCFSGSWRSHPFPT